MSDAADLSRHRKHPLAFSPSTRCSHSHSQLEDSHSQPQHGDSHSHSKQEDSYSQPQHGTRILILDTDTRILIIDTVLM